MSTLTIPAQFMSHKRSKRRVYPKYAILKLTNSRENASKYLHHAVTFEKTNGVVQGIVTKVHGNSGCVLARFTTNLPPQDVGKIAQVKLYKIDLDDI